MDRAFLPRDGSKACTSRLPSETAPSFGSEVVFSARSTPLVRCTTSTSDPLSGPMSAMSRVRQADVSYAISAPSPPGPPKRTRIERADAGTKCSRSMRPSPFRSWMPIELTPFTACGTFFGSAKMRFSVWW